MNELKQKSRDEVADKVDKKRILIIDDEKDFGKVVKLCLEKFGLYQVDVSHEGREGLEKIQQKKYDLVILDILMPKLEGHEVLQRIKSVSNIPVVILSAYLPPLMENQIIQQGAFACLRKPIEIDEVVLVIHKALSGEPLKS